MPFLEFNDGKIKTYSYYRAYSKSDSLFFNDDFEYNDINSPEYHLLGGGLNYGQFDTYVQYSVLPIIRYTFYKLNLQKWIHN